MTDIFDEAESDYHAERLNAALKRFAWIPLAGLAVVLVLVGGFEYWQARRNDANMNAARAYLAATHDGDAAMNGDDAAKAASAAQFARLAQSAPAGYRTLSLLHEAALRAAAGDLRGAEALWDRIASDPDADPLLRQLASLLWVQRGLNSADPAALRTRLVSLTAADNAYRPLALEAEAMLDLRLGQTGKARQALRAALADPAAPAGLRGRAGALLTQLGD